MCVGSEVRGDHEKDMWQANIVQGNEDKVREACGQEEDEGREEK